MTEETNGPRFTDCIVVNDPRNGVVATDTMESLLAERADLLERVKRVEARIERERQRLRIEAKAAAAKARDAAKAAEDALRVRKPRAKKEPQP